MIRRGEIWWASLATPRGSEPGYRRPVLVVQSNEFNESRISTVLVAVISSQLNLAAAPGNHLLRAKESRLKHDSVVNVSQILTVNKTALTERVSVLSSRQMAAIEEGLALVLAMARG